MVGVRYTICHWAINRTDPQNLLSTTLDVPLQLQCVHLGSCYYGQAYRANSLLSISGNSLGLCQICQVEHI